MNLQSGADAEQADATAEDAVEDAVEGSGPSTPSTPKPSAGRPPTALQACSVAARDLVGRLLERDPRRRLRSLHALQAIGFYHNFSFADVRAKRVSAERGPAGKVSLGFG